MQIFKSMSKIVFLLITLALIAALFTNKISGEQFLVPASAVFAYYFSRKTK